MEDCPCGCLARMMPIAEACRYSDALELTRAPHHTNTNRPLFFLSPKIRSRVPPTPTPAPCSSPEIDMEDCPCGCLARMVPIAEACRYSDGLELTQTERRALLSCLLTGDLGFRAPFLHRLTDADLQDSWKLPSTIMFAAPSSGRLKLETVHKNGYEEMQVDYNIDTDGCFNIAAGWKEFVSLNGFEAGEAVIVMFYREE